MFRRLARDFAWSVVLVWGAVVASSAGAQDLGVVEDGGHLWLVYEVVVDEGIEVQIYHQAPGDDHYRLRKLERIPSRLMPGGVAAGGGRLVLVLENGDVVTRTPHQPPMTLGWSYRSGTLPSLPAGCSLMSLAVVEAQGWALVRVETPEALAALDALPTPVAPSVSGEERDRLNLILGLPPGLDLDGGGRPGDATPEPDAGDGPDDDAPADADAESGAAADADTDADADDQANTETPAPPAERELPAAVVPELDRLPTTRLIRTGAAGWRSVALPDGFGQPGAASLVVLDAGDSRPAIVAEDTRRFGEVRVYRPSSADGWSETRYRLPSAQGWSATAVGGQLVLGVERQLAEDRVWADVFLLRAGRVVPLATLGVDTAGLARWRVAGVDGQAVLFAAPGPMLETQPRSPAILGAKGVGLVTGQEGELTWFVPAEQTRWETNADWLIQIGAFFGAMVLMMLFWKRTPRGREVDLPPDIHLVPWPRRLTATLIDLLPGFWITGLVYGMGWDAIVLQHWPGTPIPKPPVAMGPGWMVIGITVFHTTAFEFITARSIGKWLTGIYVSDFRGRPAPPGASFARAAMRVFDLVAWLLLLLPLISPHRQRLGDILAKTLVVMRDDPEPSEKKKDEG